MVLLTDGTVISITEDPYPHKRNYSKAEKRKISLIRSNLRNAFQQLSRAYNIKDKNPMTLLPLRKRLGNSYADNIHEPQDAPSLLFYSLFDDWAATYSLITDKERQFSGALNELVRISSYKLLNF